MKAKIEEFIYFTLSLIILTAMFYYTFMGVIL